MSDIWLFQRDGLSSLYTYFRYCTVFSFIYYSYVICAVYYEICMHFPHLPSCSFLPRNHIYQRNASNLSLVISITHRSQSILSPFIILKSF